MNTEKHTVALNGHKTDVEVRIIREGTWSDLGVYYSNRFCEVKKVNGEQVLDYFLKHTNTYFLDMKTIKAQIA